MYFFIFVFGPLDFSVMVIYCDEKIILRLEGYSTPKALLSRPIVKGKKPPRVLVEGVTASSV